MVKKEEKPEFLYAGDIWRALWGEKFPRMLGYSLSHTIGEGLPYFTHKEFSFWEYRPWRSLIAFELVLKHEEKQNAVWSFFAFCQGYENDLVLTDVLSTAEDQITEGYIKLRKNKAAAMWMFNPLYGQQASALLSRVGEQNGAQKFFVAGIGWNIEKTPEEKQQISSGPLYESELRIFLKNNPDKTPKDFPHVTLDIGHTNSLFVTEECQDAYNFSADIRAIKKFSCRFTKFYCLEIEVLNYSDEKFMNKDGMIINLYVNKKSLGDYKPQVGDNICGLMQLTAYADMEHIKQPKKAADYFSGVKQWIKNLRK